MNLDQEYDEFHSGGWRALIEIICIVGIFYFLVTVFNWIVF